MVAAAAAVLVVLGRVLVLLLARGAVEAPVFFCWNNIVFSSDFHKRKSSLAYTDFAKVDKPLPRRGFSYGNAYGLKQEFFCVSGNLKKNYELTCFCCEKDRLQVRCWSAVAELGQMCCRFSSPSGRQFLLVLICTWG